MAPIALLCKTFPQFVITKSKYLNTNKSVVTVCDLPHADTRNRNCRGHLRRYAQPHGNTIIVTRDEYSGFILVIFLTAVRQRFPANSQNISENVQRNRYN